jgi:hypothetical protein
MKKILALLPEGFSATTHDIEMSGTCSHHRVAVVC